MSDSKKTEHARTISYRWWRTDGGEIVPAHVEPLDNHAAERILSAFQEGFSSAGAWMRAYARRTSPRRKFTTPAGGKRKREAQHERR